jgi:hypothetical protein
MLDVEELHIDDRRKQHMDDIVNSGKITSFQPRGAVPVLLPGYCRN